MYLEWFHNRQITYINTEKGGIRAKYSAVLPYRRVY